MSRSGRIRGVGAYRPTPQRTLHEDGSVTEVPDGIGLLLTERLSFSSRQREVGWPAIEAAVREIAASTGETVRVFVRVRGGANPRPLVEEVGGVTIKKGRYGYGMGGAPKSPPWKRDFAPGYTAEWEHDSCSALAAKDEAPPRYVLRCSLRQVDTDDVVASRGNVAVDALDDPVLIDVEAALWADATLAASERKYGRPTRFDRI